MNTHTIHCPQGSQRCPSPWACGEGCNFNNATLPKQSAQERAQERAAVKFTEMEFPIDMQPDAGDLAIAWMQRWAKHVFWVSVIVGLGIYFWGRS